MKITVSQLRQIVKEEVSRTLRETGGVDKVGAVIGRYTAEPMRWEYARDEFEAWASGDHSEVREKYYPGWKDSDFQTVIDAIEGQRARAYDKI